MEGPRYMSWVRGGESFFKCSECYRISRVTLRNRMPFCIERALFYFLEKMRENSIFLRREKTLFAYPLFLSPYLFSGKWFYYSNFLGFGRELVWKWKFLAQKKIRRHTHTAVKFDEISWLILWGTVYHIWYTFSSLLFFSLWIYYDN